MVRDDPALHRSFAERRYSVGWSYFDWVWSAIQRKCVGVEGPITPLSRTTPALSRSGKMDGSAMSGPCSGRAYVGLKYSGGWSGSL